MVSIPKPVTGPWKISDIYELGSPRNGLKVFSCFHCGGGSTMGYKLAGFDVLGGVEIDPEMMSIYKENHKPKYSYLMGVQDFKNIPDSELPAELFNLDVLDGSPPCSSFSMAGSREDAWGKQKKFREGQADQVLDDLFFHFIDVANKLRPKIVIAENVKGLVQGNARGYVKEIFQHFREAGYATQLFLLNAASMGVPQARERTFFIARRKDLELNEIKLSFNIKPITIRKAFSHLGPQNGRYLSEESMRIWKQIKPGMRFSKVRNGSRFNDWRLPLDEIAGTITANGTICHPEHPRHLSSEEYAIIQSFPLDYNFGNQKPQYVCGMSVPPLMMQQIALKIAELLISSNESHQSPSELRP